MSQYIAVAPREGRVSRNETRHLMFDQYRVAPREGRVSRNDMDFRFVHPPLRSRPARGV